MMLRLTLPVLLTLVRLLVRVVDAQERTASRQLRRIPLPWMNVITTTSST